MNGAPNIIDIEASGFGSQSYPIEVGLALSSGDKYCSLVQPLPEWTFWDKGAEEVHGITRSILEEYGRPVSEVAEKLNAFLENQTAYSDGWEVDGPWLNMLFYAASMPKRFRFSTLEFILSGEQMESWHEIKERVLEETDFARHRASQDALIVQATYLRTR